MSIRQLPSSERPRERLLQHGLGVMSAAELIALILGSGGKGVPVLQLAHQLIAHFGSLEDLAEASLQELCAFRGMGQAKAMQLQAAMHLGSRRRTPEKTLGKPIAHHSQIYPRLKERLQDEKREIFLLVMLDTRGSLINDEIISIGTLSQTMVHPREVFYPAIRHKASSLIVVHNHPSGDPTPSKQDIAITRQLLQVSKIMGIPLHDHLIIGLSSYTSLRATTTLWT